MILLRKVIGDVLRARRLAQHRTLREVSTVANVSLGYLSEIERGHKEASSELLAAVCEALGTGLADVLSEVSATFALVEQMEQAFTADLPEVALPGEVLVPGDVLAGADAPGPAMITAGDLTVSVRSDGPLRTTLTARRNDAGRESLLV